MKSLPIPNVRLSNRCRSVTSYLPCARTPFERAFTQALQRGEVPVVNLKEADCIRSWHKSFAVRAPFITCDGTILVKGQGRFARLAGDGGSSVAWRQWQRAMDPEDLLHLAVEQALREGDTLVFFDRKTYSDVNKLARKLTVHGALAPYLKFVE